MPNIRIKDIPTTASATVNGDFFAVDSNASTRKLNAFAPTFGGGIVVAGGSFAAASLYKSATIGTVLSGAAGSTHDFFLCNPSGSYVMQVPTGTRNVEFAATLSTIGNTTVGADLIVSGSTATLGTSASAGSTIKVISGVGNLVTPKYSTLDFRTYNDDGSGAYIRTGNRQSDTNQWLLEIATRSNANVLTHVATFLDSGLLLGTTTNSSNGRLQLAAHTAISGGIGFGPNMALYLRSANSVRLESTTSGTLFEVHDGSRGYQFITSGGNDLVLQSTGNAANGLYLRAHSGPLVLQSNSTAALTLDTSQNATFAKDILLGTNGPSVPSTLSGRAPRQGLVSDGTGLITVTSPTIGTGDFTASAWINVVSYVASVFGFSGAGGVNSAVLDFPSNTVMRVYDGATTNAYTITVPTRPTNKWFNATWVRSAGVVTFYIDGVAQGSIAANFDIGSVNYIGSISAFNKTTGKLSGCYTYNRALSADEVRQLYENGVPATEDLGVAGSIAPSNTTLTTSAVAQNFAYDTFSSTTNSFSAVETGGQACEANFISGTTFLGKAPRGARFRVSFTATLTSGATPSVRLSTQAVAGTSSAIVNVVNGSNSIILQLIEPFTAETGTGAGRVTFATGSNTNYSISNLVVTRLGTVLAPDATQTGGGLTWYDTSGNGANIALPASGVAWNVPTSGNVTSGGQLNLRAGGTNNNVFISPTGTGAIRIGGTTTANLWSDSGLNLGIGTASGGSGLTFLSGSQTALFGTTTDSSNGRIQLATHTASSGGIGFGADVTLYRSAADTLRTDDAFQAERVSGDNSASAILGVLNTSGAGVTNSFGIDARVIVNNSSGTTGSAIGLRALSRVSNASNVGAAIALVAQVDNPGAGTITTAYGLYVNPITVGANNYSIFTEGVAPARFGGNVLVAGTLAANGTTFSLSTSSSNGSFINMDGIAGNFKIITTKTAGVDRWYFGQDTAAETGSNAGSPFFIRALTDAGAVIDSPLIITRAAGGRITASRPTTISDATISNSTSSGALVVTGGVGIGGSTYIGGNLAVTGTVIDPAITGTILEDIFTITDAAAFEVDPGNGSIQLITLGASRTPKATNFAAGESVTMMIDDGTAFTLTWTDATWGTGGVKWVGGSAPTLATTGYTVIQLWKVGTQVYGARVGDVV